MRADLDALRIEMERERAKLRTLQEIGVLLGSTLDLNELLTMVLERISDVMDADRSTLYLLDEDTGELWSKLAQGEHVHEIRLKVGEGLAGSVAKTGKSLNLKDAYQDVRFDAEWDRRTGYRTRSVLCVPMKNQHGRTIGVVQVLNKKDGGWFTREDEALLGALSSQAAVSIENSKLFLSVVGKNIELLETQEQLQKKIRELDVLFEIAQVSAGAMELDELLQGVLARTMRAVDAEAASILLADEVTGNLHFRAAVGGEPKKVQRLQIKSGSGICGWVAKHGKPQVVNRVDDDVRHSRHISEEVGYHPRNVLCVPLRWDDGDRQGIGAVELLNKSKGQADFTDDDLKLATVIAGHVSTAIEQARSRERREREQRLSALGQFLSSVLHDLKTPMTVIKGYVRMLASEEDQEVRQQYVDTVLAQVEILDAMTRETLAFARGDRKLWVRKVYLYKFFEDLAEQLRRALGDRMEIELELRDRGVAHFDAPKVQRAAHNLARNAAEAAAALDRKGTFRIVVDRREDGALLLRFEDDGPGVPEAIKERLFESFTTHGKDEGTGLGLAIVRQIVEDHGGEIAFESEPGRTVFAITLPQSADGAITSSGDRAAAS
ncbi:MAG: histidine kinase [Sandaracinus sp.]|nr:histidine kinase [Myxococcales bacterium]MAT24759.1 histidine kinase [Sandaracinus sp.]HJK94169.1 GAF domain-containing protein [Polyangiaceae bacterium LLY-WYZ-15_(1-7)]MBJ72842.1 histidine kinase [Sandaracinus sp.]HJL00035.1 GAF domain-containing protein [Polyangiaceae bacterium LLY-WYZ-15_(1-7)]